MNDRESAWLERAMELVGKGSSAGTSLANPGDGEEAKALSVLRRGLAPLALDADEEAIPADLFHKTLARTAEYIVSVRAVDSVPVESSAEFDFSPIGGSSAVPPVKTKPASLPTIFPAEPNDGLPPEGGRRRHWLVAICLGLALGLLAIPALFEVRTQQQQVACADNLRVFHDAVQGYRSLNDGRLPMVDEGQRASEIVNELERSGQVTDMRKLICPAGSHRVEPGSGLGNYAYNLGWRDDRESLHGPKVDNGSNTLVILADSPRREGTTHGPGNHRRGQNVLYAGGNVAFCTHSLVGNNRDDIFVNWNRKVGAGVNQWDTSLGRADETP